MSGAGQERYFCDYAWLGGDRANADVLVTVAAGRIASVEPGAARPPDARHLAGLTLPGFANAHSHAFHRALRGRSEHLRGTFWGWREEMYRIAATLSPDTYYELARATYAEMAMSGFTVVGEFHYLHHQQGGTPYAEPNAMGDALAAAAASAGVRITLIDACYFEGAPGQSPEGVQLRFCDVDADSWAARSAQAPLGAHVRAGAAIHSLRAVPPGPAAFVARTAGDRKIPLHFHLGEQPVENEQVEAAYGRTAVELLDAAGALRREATAIHATHLSDDDVTVLGASGAGTCMCPTTERDLGDGIGPAARLERSGSSLSLGTDSHAVIDAFEEMRGLELGERLASGQRGHWSAAELLRAATATGHAALGWPEGGHIASGALADLVCVALDSPRLAGAGAGAGLLLEHVVFAATAGDVTDVIVGGQPVVSGGAHRRIDTVAGALASAIRAVTP